MFHFGENVPPQYALLSRFEGIVCLLCGLENGRLFSLISNISTGKLFDSKKILLNSLTIAKDDFLAIELIDFIQGLHIYAVPLGEHACHICHLEQYHS